jgi:hypothetical protein
MILLQDYRVDHATANTGMRSQKFKNAFLVRLSLGGVLLTPEHKLLAVPGVIAAEIRPTATTAKVMQFAALPIFEIKVGEWQLLTALSARLRHTQHYLHGASREASHGPQKASSRRHNSEVTEGERPGSNRRPSGPQPDALTY